MIEPCQYCASERVAAVLDKRMEASPTAGNKYRQRCLSCERWLPMCSAADFQTAEHQHVLPRDTDAEEDDPTVPANEYDGPVDGVSTAQSADGDEEAMTDGGEVQDGESADRDDVNRFECPKCGDQVEGYPESCPHDGCGVPYQWDN